MTAAVLERSRSTSSHRAAPRSTSRSGARTSGRSGRSSAATAEALRPTPRRAERRRPKLKVLNQQAIRQRARRRNALLVLFIVVLLGFFAVAFVHADLVAGQQDLDAVRARIAEAEAYKAKVARQVEEASSPQAIVGRAEELGMVRAHQPIYLDAVAPVRDVAAIVALTPASPTGGIDLVAAPGIATGVSSDAAVAPAPSEGDPLQAAPAQPGDVPVDDVPVDDVVVTTAPAANDRGVVAETTVVVPSNDSEPSSASLGGISVSSPGSSGSSAAQRAAAGPETGQTPAATAAPAVSGASVGTAPSVSTTPQSPQTQSSIAGSRAVTAGPGSGGGSG